MSLTLNAGFDFRAGLRSGQSHLISRYVTVFVQSIGTVELQQVYLFSRADRRLQPGQVLRRPARGAGTHQPGSGRGAPAPEDGESSRWPAWFWPASADSRARCRRRPCPHPHPGPACNRLVHAHCMCVEPAPVPTIPMQQCVQRRSRPEQLLATSCKEKSRIRLESTIENLSE